MAKKNNAVFIIIIEQQFPFHKQYDLFIRVFIDYDRGGISLLNKILEVFFFCFDGTIEILVKQYRHNEKV